MGFALGKCYHGKFGEDRGGWCSREVRGVFRTGVWKEIIREWDTTVSQTVYSLGNGRRLRFWKDVWCEDEVLCLSFPSQFSLAANKDVLLANVWEGRGGLVP